MFTFTLLSLSLFVAWFVSLSGVDLLLHIPPPPPVPFLSVHHPRFALWRLLLRSMECSPAQPASASQHANPFRATYLREYWWPPTRVCVCVWVHTRGGSYVPMERNNKMKSS
uniref:Putative secreted peptide n=1 Tax=Anopheles braziliensis TaxID=58242 RepID=A0A2M3ZVP8_9DIPT